ncbi:hypothetical protein L915_19629 [Phytophthora nicotianae]|uniref:Uncharacterized protein n=1 Tax=Phytophthora nicotianae TaxID=4792 RepID=W2FTT2_PHYNI|nr:hypothetical protein L915_19629 [Phytophthora nicotianae]
MLILPDRSGLTSGVPRAGAIKEVATKFGVDRKTVSRLWKHAEEEQDKSDMIRSPSQPPRWRNEAPCGRIGGVWCGTSQTSSTCTRRPAFDSRQHRYALAHGHAYSQEIGMVHPTRATCLAAFNDMFKTIHVDEKLFYTEVRRRYYLLPGKAIPHRHVRSKRYITKVMMLAAVARPRWDPESGTYFDGKLSISPFVERKPAVPSSQRRPAETTEEECKSIGEDMRVSEDGKRMAPALSTARLTVRAIAKYIKSD